MKTIRVFLFLVLTLACSEAMQAQRKLVVADVETLMPVGGANVVGKGFAIQADSMGHFELPDSSRTVVFSHVNYESRIVNMEEIRDTVYLISKLLSVEGVVVFGKGKNDDKLKELKKRLGFNKTEAELIGADPARGTDLLKLFNYLTPKSKRKKYKQQQLKRALDEY